MKPAKQEAWHWCHPPGTRRKRAEL